MEEAASPGQVEARAEAFSALRALGVGETEARLLLASVAGTTALVKLALRQRLKLNGADRVYPVHRDAPSHAREPEAVYGAVAFRATLPPCSPPC